MSWFSFVAGRRSRSPHASGVRRVRARRGTAVMEAALIFPFLIVLSFGSVEFGHYFFVKHSFQGAAREGARAGITPGATNTEVINAVKLAMDSAGFAQNKYTVSIRNAADTANVNVSSVTPPASILVKVSANWGTVGIRPFGWIDSGKLVVGSTVMRKEG